MRSRRPVLLIALAAVAATVAYSWWDPAVAAAGLSPDDVALDWLAPLVAAVAMAFVAALRRGTERGAWALFAVGTACWAAGSLMWAVVLLTGTAMSDPGPADVFFLATPAAWVAGLIVRAGGRRRDEAGPGVIDGLLAAVATLLLLGLAIRQLTSISEIGPATLVELAYPIGDAIVITLLGRALVRRDDPDPRVPVLLIVGWAFIGLADVIYLLLHAFGTYGDEPALLDSPWTTGFVVLLGAALPARREPAPPPRAPPRAARWMMCARKARWDASSPGWQESGGPVSLSSSAPPSAFPACIGQAGSTRRSTAGC